MAAPVTVAGFGTAAVTVAAVGSSSLVLDVFPAYFPGIFGVAVGAPSTTATVG